MSNLFSDVARYTGTRGGKDQFKWDDVKEDKYKENYLGQSCKFNNNWIWETPEKKKDGKVTDKKKRKSPGKKEKEIPKERKHRKRKSPGEKEKEIPKERKHRKRTGKKESRETREDTSDERKNKRKKREEKEKKKNKEKKGKTHKESIEKELIEIKQRENDLLLQALGLKQTSTGKKDSKYSFSRSELKEILKKGNTTTSEDTTFDVDRMKGVGFGGYSGISLDALSSKTTLDSELQEGASHIKDKYVQNKF